MNRHVSFPMARAVRATLLNPGPVWSGFRFVRRLFRDWPRLYLARGLHEPRVKVRVRGGMAFTIRPRTSDMYILDEVIREEVYTRHVWPMSNHPWVFDVGGHIGGFSVLASSRWPRARIAVFEPHPDNYDLLVQNLEWNHCRATPRQVAIGEGGRGVLFASTTNTGTHSLHGEGESGIPVRKLSLREAIGPDVTRVDLLKMDCEGAEYEVLESLDGETWERIQGLALEFHATPELTLDEGRTRLERLLVGRGFRVWYPVEDMPILYAAKS